MNETINSIFQLLGQEYESDREVYDINGVNILHPADTFILCSIDDNGLCSIIKTGHFPDAQVKKVSKDETIWLYYDVIEDCESTGRFLNDDDGMIGLGKPGKLQLQVL